MRILMISHGYPPHQRGGTESHVRLLAATLADIGHEVSVFSGSSSGLADDESLDGNVTVFRCPHLPSRDQRMVVADSLVESRFKELLTKLQPDVVHIHHLLFLSLNIPSIVSKAGLPIVTTIHDFWLLSPDFNPVMPVRAQPARRALDAIVRGWRHPRTATWSIPRASSRARAAERALLGSDRIIAASEFARNVVESLGYPQSCLTTAPHGTQPAAPSRFGSRHDDLRLTFLGNLVPNKGLHVLLRELRYLPPELQVIVRLDVWGQFCDARYRSRLGAVASGMRVAFHGAFDPKDLDRVFADSDVLVLPALWHETFSLVVREAAARGVPAIVSDFGALPEAVRSGGGAVVEVRKRGAIAEVVERVARDRRLLEQWRTDLADVVDPLSNAQAVLAVYAAAIEDREHEHAS